jgi:transposase
MTTYIGLDIGKFEIYYHYQLAGQDVSGKFVNTAQEIEAFLDGLPADAQGIMEATGVYHFPLGMALQDRQIPFTLLNPATSAGYAQSLGTISKTDKSDSAMLARLGRERQPPATRLESGQWYAFRLLIKRWEDLKNKAQAIENQVESLSFYPEVNPMISRQVQDELQLIRKQIEELSQHIEQNLPTDYEQSLHLASSIKGIGKKTALHLLFFTRGLRDFSDCGQLAKYIGIAPKVYQSGKTMRRGSMSKQGQALLRSLLYNCAKAAKRFNTACKELYERLRSKGKPHKVAMVAVMHKLVKQFFAVVKSGQVYQDDYHTRLANS